LLYFRSIIWGLTSYTPYRDKESCAVSLCVLIRDKTTMNKGMEIAINDKLTTCCFAK
jgi:hypothetical protein